MAPRAQQGSTTIKAVKFGSTATVQIAHLLGRVYVGWHSHTAKGAPATLYETTSTDTTKYLVLVNGAATTFTCDIEVW